MAALAESLAAKVIALAIIVIMISSVAIPTILSAQEESTSETFSNKDVLDVSLSGSYYTKNVTATIDTTEAATLADAIITVNGSVVDLPDAWATTVFWSGDNVNCRINGSDATSTASDILISGITTDNTPYFNFGMKMGGVNTIVFDSSAKTITVSGLAQSDSSEVSLVFASERIFTIENKGKCGYASSANVIKQAFISEDQMDGADTYGQLYQRNTSLTLGESTVSVLLVSDGIETQVYTTTDYSGDPLSATISYAGGSLVDGTTDVYKGVTATFTVTDGTNTATLDAYRSFIPIEISGHVTSNEMSGLIGIIPILLIICAVMFAVRMMGSKN